MLSCRILQNSAKLTEIIGEKQKQKNKEYFANKAKYLYAEKKWWKSSDESWLLAL